MTPRHFAEIADALCAVCRRFGERNWCLATSGNFSARVGEDLCLITQSGRDKSMLGIDDLMLCGLDGRALDDACRPSAETPLHLALYAQDDSIGSVLHTHSVASTVLSRAAGDTLSLEGFEMQKAFDGVQSHDESRAIRVFDNDQDIPALALRVRDAFADGEVVVPGFLIRGHGLYAWGHDISEAARHVEGFEFLLQCLLHESRAPAR